MFLQNNTSGLFYIIYYHIQINTMGGLLFLIVFLLLKMIVMNKRVFL